MVPELPESDLSRLIQRLVERISREVQSVIQTGRLFTGNKLRIRPRFGGFSYDDDGAHCQEGWIEYTESKEWHAKEFLDLENVIKATEEYHAVALFLEKNFPAVLGSGSLNAFVQQLARSMIPGEEATDSCFVSGFVEWITERRVRTEAFAELDGIVVLSDPIQIPGADTQILLRPISLVDIEQEFTIDMNYIGVSYADYRWPPSAILEMSTNGLDNQVQTAVRQSVAILRLFSVGSISDSCIRIRGQRFAGALASRIEHTHINRWPKFKYSADQELGARLILFWTQLRDCLPAHLFHVTSTTKDYLSIAYERYSEALTLRLGFERTVSDSVMALESLFLRETSELQFRLKLFVTRILGLLGCNPIEVAKLLKLAYKIRSNFVHGQLLTPKEQNKIKRVYGSETEFERRLLDCTRISIIAMTTLHSESRNRLLDLIEQSMTSAPAAREFEDLLANAASLLKVDSTSVHKVGQGQA